MYSQSSSPKPKLISLFCGAGGLDLGFSQAGFDVSFAADYDNAAIESYNNNHPGRLGHVIDLLETTQAALCEKVRSVCGEASVMAGIIGGPPCQGVAVRGALRCAGFLFSRSVNPRTAATHLFDSRER